MTKLDPILPPEVLRDVRELITEARRQTAVAVNVGLTVLYWRIGKRLSVEVLKSERAAYGEQIVATVARELVDEFGRGYTEKSLRRMIQFAESFPEEAIVATLWRQLSWSHFRRASAPEPALSTRVLRGDVPYRGLERTHATAKNRLHAL